MRRFKINLNTLSTETIERYISQHPAPPLQCDEETYQRMIDYLKSSQENSDHVNFCLGMLYYYGYTDAIGINIGLAKDHLKLVADNDTDHRIEASYALGLLLCQYDEKTATHYLTDSANFGAYHAQHALSLIYFHQKQFNLAIPFLESSKQYFELGLIYCDQKENKKAIQCFTQAIQKANLLPFNIPAADFVREHLNDISLISKNLISYGLIKAAITHGNPLRELLRTMLSPAKFDAVDTEMLKTAYSADPTRLFITAVFCARYAPESPLPDPITPLQKFARHRLFAPRFLTTINAYAQSSTHDIENLFSA